MADDRIIDFNELKNKVKDSDVDKFEQYIYNLYFSVMDGKLSMMDFSKKIQEYMQENNIAQDKFIKIQNKFMERYGFDTAEIESQLKSFGIDPNNLSNLDPTSSSFENIKNSLGFYEKYKSKIQPKNSMNMRLKNEVNDINILLQEEIVILRSYKSINLVDSELNDILLTYKNALNKKIKIILCENTTEYDY